MQREIVKRLMVMNERAQSHRQIIRQAANAELLAADHSQTRSTSICHVYLRKQMLSCQSCIQCNLTGCLIPTCCCVSVCVCVFLHFTLHLCCQSTIRLCLFSRIVLVLLIRGSHKRHMLSLQKANIIDNLSRLAFILFPWCSGEMLTAI